VPRGGGGWRRACGARRGAACTRLALKGTALRAVALWLSRAARRGTAWVAVRLAPALDGGARLAVPRGGARVSRAARECSPRRERGGAARGGAPTRCAGVDRDVELRRRGGACGCAPSGRARHAPVAAPPPRPRPRDERLVSAVSAIETSCDETSAAVVTGRGRRALRSSSSVAGRARAVRAASCGDRERAHLTAIVPVVERASPTRGSPRATRRGGGDARAGWSARCWWG
jgi:hypothetical protein